MLYSKAKCWQRTSHFVCRWKPQALGSRTYLLRLSVQVRVIAFPHPSRKRPSRCFHSLAAPPPPDPPMTDLQLLLRRRQVVLLRLLVELCRHDALQPLLGRLLGRRRPSPSLQDRVVGGSLSREVRHHRCPWGQPAIIALAPVNNWPRPKLSKYSGRQQASNITCKATKQRLQRCRVG